MKIEGHHFLVTGGGGFIGSHLVEALAQQGAARIVVFDKMINGRNLAGLGAVRGVEVIEGDLLQSDKLDVAPRGIHGVFHLAVLPLGACEKDPRLAFEVNIRGTFNVIEGAIQRDVKKLVYSSASSVYGDTLEVVDEHHPFNPWTMYGVSKLCGEFLLRPFRSKLPYVILRYMNVYGPRQEGGLIPAVLTKIRAGESPVINGDGSAAFDFVHVRDVVRCNVLAMASEIEAEAFNVGSGTEATVKDVVTRLLQLTGSSLKPVYRRDVDVPMMRRVGSSEKAGRMLGYRPSIALHEGLAELVKGI